MLYFAVAIVALVILVVVLVTPEEYGPDECDHDRSENGD